MNWQAFPALTFGKAVFFARKNSVYGMALRMTRRRILLPVQVVFPDLSVEKVYSHGFSPPCSYHLSPCCSACPCTHCNDTTNPLNLAKKPSLGWSWADPAAATAEELTPLMQPMTFLHLLLFLFSSMLHLQGKSRCIYISTLINQHCTPHTQRCYIYVSFPKTAIYALPVVHNSVCPNHSLES